MSKIYMLRHPGTKVPVAIFSDYETPMDLASRLFRSCSLADYENCLEEWDLDPLKDKLDKGIYPWTVYINVVTNETNIADIPEIFTKESIDYAQGKLAKALVFAADEESAENRASELWMDYQSGEESIKPISVYRVKIDEEGEIDEISRTIAYTPNTDINDVVKELSRHVEIRVVADSLDSAIEKARIKYDTWIDEQVDQLIES